MSKDVDPTNKDISTYTTTTDIIENNEISTSTTTTTNTDTDTIINIKNNKRENEDNNNNKVEEPPTKKRRNKGIFVFKHFTVLQDLPIGQKVGTDALLVAGYTSINRFSPGCKPDSQNYRFNQMIWENKEYDYDFGESDIGTGTNVLSLMLGQRFRNSIINSIDIDESAIKQSTINIDNIYEQQSDKSCSKNIHLFHTSIQDFNPLITKPIDLKRYQTLQQQQQQKTPIDSKYDLIISAPPYFPSDVNIDKIVVTMQNNRRVARHTHTLTMDDLVQSVCKLIRPGTGIFTTIVSVPQPSEDLEIAAKKHGLKCLEMVDVSDSPGTKIIRKMYTFKLPIGKTLNENIEQQQSSSPTKEEEEEKEKEKEEIETIKRQFTIYETTIKETTLTQHRKHRHLLSTFVKKSFNWVPTTFTPSFRNAYRTPLPLDLFWPLPPSLPIPIGKFYRMSAILNLGPSFHHRIFLGLEEPFSLVVLE
eukprot:gene5406-6743_t